jgi:hypothetical protein
MQLSFSSMFRGVAHHEECARVGVRKVPSLFAGVALVLFAALVGCGSDGPAVSSCTSLDALVLASDRSSTALGLWGCGVVRLESGLDLGLDAQLVTSRGRRFVLARDTQTVFEWSQGRLLGRRSLAAAAGEGGRNPQGIAVSEQGELWVPFFDEARIGVYRAPKWDDPKESVLTQVEEVDTAGFDVDANPEASMAFSLGSGSASRIVVALGNLTFVPSAALVKLQSIEPSQLAWFDPQSRKLERRTKLLLRNPFGVPKDWGSDRVALAMAGQVEDDQELDAGVEVVALEGSRVLVRERELGGSAIDVARVGACGFAIVMDKSAANRTRVVSFDAESGANVKTDLLGTSDDFNRGFLGLFAAGSDLLVGNRKKNQRGFYDLVRYRVRPSCELSESARVESRSPPISFAAP